MTLNSLPSLDPCCKLFARTCDSLPILGRQSRIGNISTSEPPRLEDLRFMTTTKDLPR